MSEGEHSSTDTALGHLLLLPVGLSASPWSGWLPAEAQQRVGQLEHFVVENEKAARAHLRQLEHPRPLRELKLTPLPEAGPRDALDALLAPALQGHDIGLLSDAGCPAVADPGARLVARAHELGIPVRPFVGPSSILLALMASGLEGQRFSFHGYLPVNEPERSQRLRALEAESRQEQRTQIFIETPYRNQRLLEAALNTLAPHTRLALAVDLTAETEQIFSKPVELWRNTASPDLARRPAIFLLLAGAGK